MVVDSDILGCNLHWLLENSATNHINVELTEGASELVVVGRNNHGCSPLTKLSNDTGHQIDAADIELSKGLV